MGCGLGSAREQITVRSETRRYMYIGEAFVKQVSYKYIHDQDIKLRGLGGNDLLN
jgi:hypothetical protein